MSATSASSRTARSSTRSVRWRSAAAASRWALAPACHVIRGAATPTMPVTTTAAIAMRRSGDRCTIGGDAEEARFPPTASPGCPPRRRAIPHMQATRARSDSSPLAVALLIGHSPRSHSHAKPIRSALPLSIRFPAPSVAAALWTRMSAQPHPVCTSRSAIARVIILAVIAFHAEQRRAIGGACRLAV